MPVFPSGGAAMVQQLFEQHTDLANGSEDDRRTLTRLIASQMAFSFGVQWGTKSTTKDHPQSKDAIAYRYDDGTIAVWDWQNGTTRQPQVQDGSAPNYDRLAQYFIAVPPVNHLGVEPAPGPPPGPPEGPLPPPAPVPSLPDVTGAIFALVAQVNLLRGELQTMRQEQAAGLSGSLFGYTLVLNWLKPKAKRK